MNDQERRNSSSIILNVFVYILLALVFIMPRFYALDQYVTPDENLWLQRSANFYFALGQRDYAHTFQREYPGVTGTWAGTFGFLQEYPDYRGTGAGYFDSSGMMNMFLEERGADPLAIMVAGRRAVVVFCALACLAAFAVLRRFTGLPAALLAYLLIAFDPFFFGLSRLLHLDAMLASFMFLSLLAFLAYLHLGRRWPYLLLSAIGAGLSWLTKSPALFLIPMVGLLALIDRPPEIKAGRVKGLWNFTRPLLIWGLAAFVLFVVLWPSMWLNPVSSVKAIFDVSIEYATLGHYSQHLFYGRLSNGGDFPWWYYPVMFLWRATPVTLVGLLLAALGSWRGWGLLAQPKVRRLLRDGLLFAVLFMIFMHVGAKKFDRYMLPAFLWLELAAALGWYAAVTWMVALLHTDKWKTALNYAVLAAVVLLQGLTVAGSSPYYITYYNPWMGGLPKAAQVQTVGWGEGLEQAGAYLDGLADGYKLDVMSWYGFGSLSYYFDGKVDAVSPSQEWDRENAEKLREADYVVAYVNQRQRQMTRQLLEMLEDMTPEYVFAIDGVDFVWVYNLADAPADQLQALRQYGE